MKKPKTASKFFVEKEYKWKSDKATVEKIAALSAIAGVPVVKREVVFQKDLYLYLSPQGNYIRVREEKNKKRRYLLSIKTAGGEGEGKILRLQQDVVLTAEEFAQIVANPKNILQIERLRPWLEKYREKIENLGWIWKKRTILWLEEGSFICCDELMYTQKEKGKFVPTAWEVELELRSNAEAVFRVQRWLSTLEGLSPTNKAKIVRLKRD